jgi:metallophosphoesterase superfamily enzyme
MSWLTSRNPAVRIDDGVRNERYKCFLIGRHQKVRLVVLPSFSTIVEGSDILKVASNSPFLQGNSSMVYVLADEVRPFGKVSDLRRILG